MNEETLFTISQIETRICIQSSKLQKIEKRRSFNVNINMIGGGTTIGYSSTATERVSGKTSLGASFSGHSSINHHHISGSSAAVVTSSPLSTSRMHLAFPYYFTINFIFTQAFISYRSLIAFPYKIRYESKIF